MALTRGKLRGRGHVGTLLLLLLQVSYYYLAQYCASKRREVSDIPYASTFSPIASK